MPNKAPGPGATLEDWLRWQEALHPQAIALGLERVGAVASRMGLPHAGPQTLTVAGTNGKGSSTAMLAETYRAAGYRTGAYSSPHLRRYNERVVVDGRACADAGLVEAFAAVESARGTTPLTYFEFGTLAALWLFRRAAVQVQVLEVGLGGRLDAVNLVDPDCALITSIGVDHVEYLGSDREAIAAEKAGILRRGQPAVCSDPEPPAAIGLRARALEAPLWQLGRDYRFQRVADAWNWLGPGRRCRKLPVPALAGAMQLQNAAGVVAVVQRMQERLPVAETALRAALARVRLPGRFERRGDVILDVAHNVEAARALADNLAGAGGTGVRLVVGMLADKPFEAFLRVLAPLALRVYLGGLPAPRGLAGASLRRRAQAAVPQAVVFETVVEAFAQARRERRDGEVIVACGSFLTVAAVQEQLDG